MGIVGATTDTCILFENGVRRNRLVLPGLSNAADHMPSKPDWQIKCHCHGGKIDYVTGFLDEQSIQNWLATEHRDHWLKIRGYHA
jgi:hypothetical protein